MDNYRFRLAALIMRHRLVVALIFLAITVFFAVGIQGLTIKTIFSDLLPADDPYVQVFKDHPNFGNPLTVTVMIKRKDGDIYNTDTLQKVWDFTRAIDLTPGINHDSLISIATEKARYAEATPYGIDMKPLMGDSVPSSQKELDKFRLNVEQSPNVRTFYVSGDESATLITAAFIEDLLDYDVVFKSVQMLAKEYRDDNHEVYVVGQPILTGWVYKLQNQTYMIFGITVCALIIALALYMRNIAGTLTPIICSTVAAVWGFGMVGWISSPIEPLLMIVPLLLVARSFSHCVQFSERYYEIYAHLQDKKKAAEVTMGVMMAPSILGVVTDTLGIVFIALAPIPAMERFALFTGFWAISIIPTGVFLISIVLSYLPTPKNIDALTSQDEVSSGVQGLQLKLLNAIAKVTHGKRAKVTAVVATVATVVAIGIAMQIKIGNPVEGSNILWEDSDFNTAIRAVNSHFPGVNTLEIILESKTRDINNRVVRTPEAVRVSLAIQSMVESDEVLAPRATLSFADYMMESNRLFSGGDPKWLPLDPTAAAVRAAGTAVVFGTNPVNFSHISDFEFQNSTISLWYKDNKQETVDAALASAQRAVDSVGVEHADFTVRMGSGTIALQQAMNSVVSRYHWLILGLLNIAIFGVVAYAYKSIVAALIILIPVNISNFMLSATMHVLGIGLDINSVMVAVLGVGVGIDYGIYLMSRICEEYTPEVGWADAITRSITTTGKAIMFTATIMLIGIMPWYLLSDLKFMADMGLLLVAIMLINMVLSLVVLPLLVWLIKPHFASRNDLMIGEGIDLSIFLEDKDTEKKSEEIIDYQGGDAVLVAR
ncbi:efflux RND transporter permease subunit [Zhongshania arctica]|uniref:RND family transporter n=1 Tax=Zhongshania arctica TaxID=3238302 RepID=A0ABV3TRM3_9GAMM|tara:strand:- start:9207 stop:11687 length:2481 start_codon:yes stop_codon:yes gene_type:complete